MAVTGNEHGFFWDSNNGDRTYNSESFELWLKKFFTSGVFQDELQVTAGGGMSVAVSAGYANCDGKVKMFDSTALTIEAASGFYPRIDTVVVERNDSDRTFYLKVVKGAYNGVTPAATAPVRTGGVYQLVLADVYVRAGATSISTGNITDKRPDGAVCGWVTGTVDEIDLQQILAQSEAQFGEWFDEMKDQLSTDAAGHLQLEIDDLVAGQSDGSVTRVGTETVGGEYTPIYLNNGEPVASTSSRGNTTTPVFLDGGVLKTGSPYVPANSGGTFGGNIVIRHSTNSNNSMLNLSNASSEGRGIFRIYRNGYYAQIEDSADFSANRTFSLPDKSGTLVVTSDLMPQRLEFSQEVVLANGPVTTLAAAMGYFGQMTLMVRARVENGSSSSASFSGRILANTVYPDSVVGTVVPVVFRAYNASNNADVGTFRLTDAGLYISVTAPAGSTWIYGSAAFSGWYD